jgi:plasmid stabilization system protein ParE
MNYRLIFSPASQKDLSIAFNYYQDINQSLAERFFEALQKAYDKLEEHPQHYSFFGNSQSLRSHEISTFPYCIIFEIKEDNIYIIGLHNTHQHPENILKRI